MRISDWSSDVCSSDLLAAALGGGDALVLEATERSALDRHGVRLRRVDLDDPAEAVELVAVLGEVEACVGCVPAVAEVQDLPRVGVRCAADIGRAAGREGVCGYGERWVGGETLK